MFIEIEIRKTIRSKSEINIQYTINYLFYFYLPAVYRAIKY